MQVHTPFRLICCRLLSAWLILGLALPSPALALRATQENRAALTSAFGNTGGLEEMLTTEDLLADTGTTFRQVVEAMQAHEHAHSGSYPSDVLSVLIPLLDPRTRTFSTEDQRAYAEQLSRMSLEELRQEGERYQDWEAGLTEPLHQICTAIPDPPYYAIAHYIRAALFPVAVARGVLGDPGRDAATYAKMAEVVREGERRWAFQCEVFYRWDIQPKPCSHTVFPAAGLEETLGVRPRSSATGLEQRGQLGLSRRQLLWAGPLAALGLMLRGDERSAHQGPVLPGRVIWLFDHHTVEQPRRVMARLEQLRTQPQPRELYFVGEHAPVSVQSLAVYDPALNELVPSLEVLDDPAVLRRIEAALARFHEAPEWAVANSQHSGQGLKDPILRYLAAHPAIQRVYERAPLGSVVANFRSVLAEHQAWHALYEATDDAAFDQAMRRFYVERERADLARDAALASRIQRLMMEHPGATIVVSRGASHAAMATRVTYGPQFTSEISGLGLHIPFPMDVALQPFRDALLRGDPLPDSRAIRRAFRGHLPLVALSIALMGQGMPVQQSHQRAMAVLEHLSDARLTQLTRDLQAQADLFSRGPGRSDPDRRFDRFSQYVVAWLQEHGCLSAELGEDLPASWVELTVPNVLEELQRGGLEETKVVAMGLPDRVHWRPVREIFPFRQWAQPDLPLPGAVIAAAKPEALDQTGASKLREIYQALVRNLAFTDYARGVEGSHPSVVQLNGLVSESEQGMVFGVELIVQDNGPGIEHLAEMVKDGVSTTGQPGRGLSYVLRQAPEVAMYSRGQAWVKTAEDGLAISAVPPGHPFAHEPSRGHPGTTVVVRLWRLQQPAPVPLRSRVLPVGLEEGRIGIYVDPPMRGGKLLTRKRPALVRQEVKSTLWNHPPLRGAKRRAVLVGVPTYSGHGEAVFRLFNHVYSTRRPFDPEHPARLIIPISVKTRTPQAAFDLATGRQLYPAEDQIQIYLDLTVEKGHLVGRRHLYRAIREVHASLWDEPAVQGVRSVVLENVPTFDNGGALGFALGGVRYSTKRRFRAKGLRRLRVVVSPATRTPQAAYHPGTGAQVYPNPRALQIFLDPPVKDGRMVGSPPLYRAVSDLHASVWDDARMRAATVVAVSGVGTIANKGFLEFSFGPGPRYPTGHPVDPAKPTKLLVLASPQTGTPQAAYDLETGEQLYPHPQHILIYLDAPLEGGRLVGAPPLFRGMLQISREFWKQERVRAAQWVIFSHVETHQRHGAAAFSWGRACELKTTRRFNPQKPLRLLVKAHPRTRKPRAAFDLATGEQVFPRRTAFRLPPAAGNGRHGWTARLQPLMAACDMPVTVDAERVDRAVGVVRDSALRARDRHDALYTMLMEMHGHTVPSLGNGNFSRSLATMLNGSSRHGGGISTPRVTKIVETLVPVLLQAEQLIDTGNRPGAMALLHAVANTSTTSLAAVRRFPAAAGASLAAGAEEVAASREGGPRATERAVADHTTRAARAEELIERLVDAGDLLWEQRNDPRTGDPVFVPPKPRTLSPAEAQRLAGDAGSSGGVIVPLDPFWEKVGSGYSVIWAQESLQAEEHVLPEVKVGVAWYPLSDDLREAILGELVQAESSPTGNDVALFDRSRVSPAELRQPLRDAGFKTPPRILLLHQDDLSALTRPVLNYLMIHGTGEPTTQTSVNGGAPEPVEMTFVSIVHDAMGHRYGVATWA